MKTVLITMLFMDCTLVGTFENPMYGPRIISLLGTKEYASIRVYRVEEP